MHKSALETGRLFFERYVDRPCTITEVGSLDVNGSFRGFAPDGSRYIGLDFTNGEGVDVLLSDPYKLPLEDNSIDVCVSSSCLEHSEFFWLSFLEMVRILKPDGLLYFSAPSNSQFHRYPVDCWRFYPDSGRALQNWAQRNGHNVLLLESFTGPQNWDMWNDFVAVFVKDERFASAHTKRIIDTYPHTNALVAGKDKVLNYREWPEDQRSLVAATRRIAQKARWGLAWRMRNRRLFR
jgi:SAM-dependent methyltransferase